MGRFYESGFAISSMLSDYRFSFVRFLFALKPMTEPIKVEIHDRRGIESKHLAENETTDDGDAEGPTKLETNPCAKS